MGGRIRRLLAILPWLALAAPALANASADRVEAGFDAEEARLVARLVVHPDDPPGAQRVGLWLEADPGWHVYWHNPGPIGLPTQLSFAIDGGTLTEVAWPAPEAFDDDDGTLAGYGYGAPTLLSSVATRAAPREADVLRVDAEVLLCERECIPASISLSHRVSELAAAGDAQRVRAIFRDQRARVPVPAAALGLESSIAYSQSAVRPGDSFRALLSVRCAAAAPESCRTLVPEAEYAFIPDQIEGAALETLRSWPDAERPGAHWLELRGEADDEEPGADQRFGGVLRLRTSEGTLRPVALDLALPRAPADSAVTITPLPLPASGAEPDAPRGFGLAYALLLGLLGGLVLNLMPCVLPVLGIKALSLAEMAGEDRGRAFAHAAAHASGVLTTLAALALAAVALRAAGESVGWGFQLQEPAFVVALGAILVAAALNLFGVFEIPFIGGSLGEIGANASGPRRSFFDGLLIVVLATPCSAPYLGSALGFAFASPAPVVFAIFLSIGVGLAAPTLAISLVPAARRAIPRPGPWMEPLRVALGFTLLASTVWLLWGVRRAVGAEGVVAILGFLVCIGFAAWLAQTLRTLRPPRRYAGFAAIVFALGWAGRAALGAGAPVDAPAASSDWRAFDRAAVESELANGRAVFVYFTADWCLTCKVNEARVLERSEVRDELARLDVAVFRADWTRRDEVLRRELARHGRAGVPLYLVYSPERPDRPALLSEFLGVAELLEALRYATNRQPVRNEQWHAAAG